MMLRINRNCQKCSTTFYLTNTEAKKLQTEKDKKNNITKKYITCPVCGYENLILVLKDNE